MARLLSIGFEVNSLTNGYEVDNLYNYSGASYGITTGRSGTGSLCSVFTTSIFGGAGANRQFLSSPTYGKYYVRFYMLTSGAPISSASIIFGVGASTGQTNYVQVNLNQNRTIVMYTGGGSGSITSSLVLSASTWYMVELGIDISDGANLIGELKINGASQGTYRSTFANGLNLVSFSDTVADGGHQMYFDDIAVNNDTGSYQNFYPGPGKLVMQTPTANGQAVAWTATGGTNVAVVQNNPPNTSTYVSSNTLNQTDWYDFTNLATGAASKINVVETLAGLNGGASAAVVKCQIQTQNSGTVVQSLPVTPGTNTFNAAGPYRYAPITSYTDPQTGSPWTVTSFNSIQAGVTIYQTGSVAAQVFEYYLQAELADPALQGVSTISNISSIALS